MRKVLLLVLLAAAVAVAGAQASGLSYWTKAQAESRVVKLVPAPLNPLRAPLRRQCAGYMKAPSRQAFNGFACILQQRNGSWFTVSLRVVSATRAKVRAVSCVHYALNTSGPRSCRK